MRKSVGEMNEPERKRVSITVKAVRATFISFIVFGALMLTLGVLIYGYTLTRSYVTRACDTARSLSNSVRNGTDSASLARSVMDVYSSLTEEQRGMVGTPAYRELFASVDVSKGSPYDVLVHMLRSYADSEGIDDVYFAMYDRSTGALVYFADPDQEIVFDPGDWESVDAGEIEKFLNWDGTGHLYDISPTEKYGWLCTAGVPVKDGTGNIYGFVLVDIGFRKLLAGMTFFVILSSIMVIALTAVISVITTRRIRNNIVNPINAIAEAAEKYVSDKRSGTGETDHFGKLDIHTGDELEHLSRIMANMERDLTHHEDEIIRISAEKERIGTELKMATLIQASMLPHIFPPYPDRTEFDVYASMTPAKEVGGDFYDFFLIDEGHLGLVMADVSGKGIPAALFMMVSKVIIQSCAMLGRGAAEILNKTNEAICSNNQVGMFVTVWVGILDIKTGLLTAANAGHEYPVLYRNGGDFEVYKDRHGLVIGGMPGMKYREYEIQLNKGDRLFLYTDGVPEATNAEKEMFGSGRMVEALNAAKSYPPALLLGHVHSAVNDFVGDAQQFDDLTMMCLEYHGSVEEQ